MGKTYRYAKNIVDNVKEIKNGAIGDIAKNVYGAYKSNQQTKKNQISIGIEKAQQRYENKYGERMTNSKLNAEGTGGLMSKPTRDYLGMKDEEIKKAKSGDYSKSNGQTAQTGLMRTEERKEIVKPILRKVEKTMVKRYTK